MSFHSGVTRRFLLPIACALALAAPATASAATPGLNISQIDNQGNPYVRDPAVYPGDATDSAAAWKDIDDSGAKTLRTFVLWNGIDDDAVGRFGLFVQHARAHGMAVDLVVTGNSGSTPTPAAYARAIAKLASGLRGSVAAYEIWNEPDLPQSWKDAPQPAAYAALLKAAHAAVKSADPNAKVISGGLVGNDFDFLSELYDHGAKGSFDAVAVHTDTACNITVPTYYYREPTGRIGRYSFTGYREVHKTMLAHGDDKPIWMTELGWSTVGGTCPVADKPAGVSPAQQADFLTKAYGCLAGDPYVQQALWFDSHDINSSSSDLNFHYGLVDDAFNRKPAFAAFTQAGSAQPIPCGGTLDDSAPSVSFVTPADKVSYSSSVPVHVRAGDDHGVKDINLYLDGKYIPLKAQIHGTSADLYKILRQAGTLSYGPHTLVAKARDEARNWGTAQLTIVRVGGGAYSATRIASTMHVHYGKLRKRRMKVSGRVDFAAGVQGEGRVELKFQRFAKGAWRPKNVRHRSVHKPFKFTFAFSTPGKWRVRARFLPFGPFQRATLAPRTFIVR
ncbi:MAG: polysaccharide biosynthesis protein PslG [Solirubrobacteraceae bacterium]|nr:polysaccharide biosynthesis protein PslG [Solirubrobacteraceae bacterium]